MPGPRGPDVWKWQEGDLGNLGALDSRFPESRALPAGMDSWTLQQTPKFPVFSFPKAGHIPRTPGARASWPQTSSSGNGGGLGGEGGRVLTSVFGALHPAPQTSPERGSRGTHRPGLRRRREQGPRLWLRWCRLWLGLRPGSGGVQALLRRGAGLDGVRPSSPLPTRETLPPALTLHLPWPEQGAPTYGHRHTGEQTDGHVDTGPAQDLGSDLGQRGERKRRWASRHV